jgi:hypothetical protein
MTKTYEQLAAEDEAAERADRVKVLFLLGILRPNMSGLEILLLNGQVGDDKEVRKRWSDAYPPGGIGQLSTLEIVEAMTKQERAEVRARVMR